MKALQLMVLVCLMVYTCNVPAQNVYITKTGDKYHKSTCHYLKHSKKEITLAMAIESGLTPCTICKPKTDRHTLQTVEVSQTLKSAPAATVPKATATQCTGKTKAGSRCKRMTKAASGRCYQH